MNILGDDHPSTLISMNNLASTYKAQGKMGEAVALQEEALHKCQRILGEDHPNIMIFMRLASTYRAQGKMLKAAALEGQIR